MRGSRPQQARFTLGRLIHRLFSGASRNWKHAAIFLNRLKFPGFSA